MPSPADRQHEARRQSIWIACELQEAVERDGRGCMALHEAERVVGELLNRGVIRPGVRPPAEEPMPGQTTIEEQLDG